MDAKCIDQFEQNSGLIVVNKKVHWKPLHLAHYFSLYREFYYQIINEHDTFRMAWKKFDASVAWPKRYNAMMGGVFMNRFCGHSIVFPDVANAEEVEEAIARDGDRRGIDMNPPLRYLVIHTTLLGSVNPRYLRSYPFRYLQRYLADSEVKYLTVFPYEEDEIGTCYELQTGLGEPEIVQEMWEKQFYPQFNAQYFRNGGYKGGEEKVFDTSRSRMIKASDLFAEQEEQARWSDDGIVDNDSNKGEGDEGNMDEKTPSLEDGADGPVAAVETKEGGDGSVDDADLDELNGRTKKPEDYEYKSQSHVNALPGADDLGEGEEESEIEVLAEKRTVQRFGVNRRSSSKKKHSDEDSEGYESYSSQRQFASGGLRKSSSVVFYKPRRLNGMRM